MLGRTSTRDHERAKRIGAWVGARTPYATFSVMAGVLAVVDAITLVIGIAMGLAAIVLGIVGLSDLRRRQDLVGKGLCRTGIVLGVLGISLSGIVWYVLRATNQG